MTIYCNKCGKENQDDAEFCQECGNKFDDIIKPVNDPHDDKSSLDSGISKKKFSFSRKNIIALAAIAIVASIFLVFIITQTLLLSENEAKDLLETELEKIGLNSGTMTVYSTNITFTSRDSSKATGNFTAILGGGYIDLKFTMTGTVKYKKTDKGWEIEKLENQKIEDMTT